jgi:hypothetical protein
MAAKGYWSEHRVCYSATLQVTCCALEERAASPSKDIAVCWNEDELSPRRCEFMRDPSRKAPHWTEGVLYSARIESSCPGANCRAAEKSTFILISSSRRMTKQAAPSPRQIQRYSFLRLTQAALALGATAPKHGAHGDGKWVILPFRKPGHAAGWQQGRPQVPPRQTVRQ